MRSVTDTPPEIAEVVSACLMSLSRAERFLMGVCMCDAARRRGLAYLPVDLPESDRKRLLFERFHPVPLPLAPHPEVSAPA